MFVHIFALYVGGGGHSRISDIRVPNPSPTLDKNLASMGPGILSSVGVGVWGKAPEAFPDSNTTLDTFESAKNHYNFTVFFSGIILQCFSQARRGPKFGLSPLISEDLGPFPH